LIQFGICYYQIQINHLGRPLLKEVIDKFMTKQKQLEEAANEIQKEREKDRERNRLGLTAEEYEALETEDPNRVA
jgi:hypothetical protein